MCFGIVVRYYLVSVTESTGTDMNVEKRIALFLYKNQ